MMTMREILFRGRHKVYYNYETEQDVFKWVYGAYGNHTSFDAMIIDRPYLTSNSDLSALNFWVVDPATVGQFTGLYDATKWEALSESEQEEWLETHTADEWKGRKIFEGDIVKIKHIDKFGVVEWQTLEARYLVFTGGDWFTMDEWTYEVIGNIHDNPEMLEVNNE